MAIKLVTRIFEKIQLAKRALREITLLRHFANHENITGLIDVDAISPDFQEMYVPFAIVCMARVVSLGNALCVQIYFHGGELGRRRSSEQRRTLICNFLADGRFVVSRKDDGVH